jgi:hypothetical protein
MPGIPPLSTHFSMASEHCPGKLKDQRGAGEGLQSGLQVIFKDKLWRQML